MSTTTEDVARSVLGSLDSDASLLLACTWVSERYQDLVSRARQRHLRQVGEFVAPGIISAGTIAVNKGETLVTGTNTNFTQVIEGRHFRAGRTWCRIAKCVSPLELHLESPYAENTIPPGGGYVICARYIALDPTARWLGDTITMARIRRPVGETSLEAMDLRYPGRLIRYSTYPYDWCDLGITQTGDGKDVRQIELYPSSTNDELYYYVFWKAALSLKNPATIIPSVVDLVRLKEGVMIDAMRQKMAVASRAGKLDEAALWRNEYRAQETRWEQQIKLAMLSDKGVDDQTFIMAKMFGGGLRRPTGDIKTGFDEVYTRGNRP